MSTDLTELAVARLAVCLALEEVARLPPGARPLGAPSEGVSDTFDVFDGGRVVQRSIGSERLGWLVFRYVEQR